MGYETAIQTKMLATHCCVCGRPLVDASSVELGIGPECRSNYAGGIDENTRILCNKLTYQAALAAQRGDLTAVRALAAEIESAGLAKLAAKIVKRFKNAETKCKIFIVERDGKLYVDTPFKRSVEDFASHWRAIPGRRWENGKNVVPVSSKAALWALLKALYAGEWLQSGRGYFRIEKRPIQKV